MSSPSRSVVSRDGGALDAVLRVVKGYRGVGPRTPRDANIPGAPGPDVKWHRADTQPAHIPHTLEIASKVFTALDTTQMLRK